MSEALSTNDGAARARAWRKSDVGKRRTRIEIRRRDLAIQYVRHRLPGVWRQLGEQAEREVES